MQWGAENFFGEELQRVGRIIFTKLNLFYFPLH
jgi:hypothetical protein